MRTRRDSLHFEQTIASDSVKAESGRLDTTLPAFFLIGKTGVGKSNFVKLLGGRTKDGQEPIVGEDIDSCTQETTLYDATINNKEVLLVDTPGFDDSGTENLDILVKIVSILFVFARASEQIKIHGVIFLHDISEIRFSGSQRKTLSILRALCGKECMGNVIIGTTKWSPEKPAKFEKEKEREQKLVEEHWGGIYKTVRLIGEDNRSAVVQIVTDLLAKAPVLLRAQKEMLTPPHTVEHTAAGKLVIPEAELERDQIQERFQAELAEQKQMFEEEKAKNDAETERLENALAEHKKMLGENSEKNDELLERFREALRELAEQKLRLEEERDAENRKRERERGFLDDLFGKLKTVPDLNFAEKLGLAIAAPIILAPAAVIAAPVGIIAAFVGLSNHFTKSRQ